MCSARKTDGTLTGHTATGNYYNWSATIASNNSSSYATSTYGDISKNPQNSICPKGWRLPTISSVTANNEFAKLNNLYNSGFATSDAGLIASPLWFAHSGLVRAGGLNNYGANGGYWSSTVHNYSLAYFLSFSNSSANPATLSDGYSYYNGKTLGRSIRCLAR